MIQFGVYWSDVTVDHVLEIDPKTYCIVQRNSFKSSSQFDSDSKWVVIGEMAVEF